SLLILCPVSSRSRRLQPLFRRTCCCSLSLRYWCLSSDLRWLCSTTSISAANWSRRKHLSSSRRWTGRRLRDGAPRAGTRSCAGRDRQPRVEREDVVVNVLRVGGAGGAGRVRRAVVRRDEAEAVAPRVPRAGRVADVMGIRPGQ